MIGRVWDIVLAFVGASLVVPRGLLTIDYGLRCGGIEYRVSDDVIVAYDRLFRTRVWRIEPWDESGLRVERDRIYRWLGTSTVIIEYSDGELRLSHLHDPDLILDVFDRRASGIPQKERM